VIVYKKFPELDLQFDERNLPSRVYKDLFIGENVWIGGYNGGMNTAARKTVSV
jgi:hypothetical protein